MALLKYVKREARPSYKPLILSQQDIEAAQKSVADAINTAANKSQWRGEYNFYSKERLAMIGKYCLCTGQGEHSCVAGSF